MDSLGTFPLLSLTRQTKITACQDFIHYGGVTPKSQECAPNSSSLCCLPLFFQMSRSWVGKGSYWGILLAFPSSKPWDILLLIPGAQHLKHIRNKAFRLKLKENTRNGIWKQWNMALDRWDRQYCSVSHRFQEQISGLHGPLRAKQKP